MSRPPGQAASAARRAPLGSELIPRHVLLQIVQAAVLIEPVGVGAVLDLLRLVVGQRPRRILLDDLIELGRADARELAAHRARSEREELLLLGHAVELPASEPADV